MDPEITKPPEGHTISWAPRHQGEVEVQLPRTTGESSQERFRIGTELARGGMGIVYRAHDLVLARDVAVKIMQIWAAAKGELVGRFWEESRITAQLQHPGIPPVYEAGVTDDGAPYLAMKLIKGETLATLLAARPDVAHERSRWLGVIEQICQAVAYAHQHQVIHRDLKPQNVMVGAFGEVQVMDWGLAKVLQAGRPAETLIRGRDACEVGETQVGDTIGTPAYMSPEQARGENDTLDPRTDVFSLGAMLCVVLTGAPPYAGKNLVELIEKARVGDVGEAIQKLQAQQLDADLVRLVNSCLAADREERPANAAEVADQLARFRLQTEERLRAAEVDAARTQVRIGEERKRRRVQLGLAGAVILLVIGGAASGLVYQRMVEEQNSLEQKRIADRQQQQLERRALEERQRAETALQEANIKTSAAAARVQADDLMQRSLWPEATEALQQVQRLLRDSSDPETRRSLEESLADVKLLARLDEINLSRFEATLHSTNLLTGSNMNDSYEAAFQARGWNVFEGQKSPAAARIAQSPARNQFIEAIDNWALGEPNPARRLQLLLAADQLTGQTWRSEFAVNWFLPARLKTMLDTVPADQQTPGFLGSVGRRLEETGDDGLAVLRAGCRKHPHSFFIHMRLASYLETSPRGSKEEAIGTYRAAVALRPRCATAWMSLGNALSNTERGEAESLACMQEAVRLDPDHAPAHLFLALAHLKRQEFSEAETACQRSLQLNAPNPGAYIVLAAVCLATDRREEALEQIRRGVKLSLPDPGVLLGLAQAYVKLKEYRLAEVPLRRAVELDPKNVAYRVELGKVLNLLKDPEAVAVLREATQLDPKQPESWHQLRVALESQNDLAGAIEVREQLTILEPNNAANFDGLAYLYELTKQPQKQVAALEAAAKLQPQNYDLQFRTAGLLAGQGNWAQAVVYFRRSVELQPDSEWAVGNLVAGLGSLGQGEEALRIARKTAERLPEKAWAQNSVGFALLSLGRKDEAKAQFEKVIALDPNFAGPYNDLGSLALSEGRYEDACAMYEKVLGIHPGGFSFARPNLGLAYQRRGELKKAEEHLAIAAQQMAAPWIKLELERTRFWLATETRAAKLRKGEEKFRNVADAFQVLDYCRQPFCNDRLLLITTCEWLIAQDMGPSTRGNVLRIEAARAAIQHAETLKTDERAAFRDKALQFLKADLDSASLSKAADDRESVGKILVNWQSDAVMRSFREVLEKLPTAERDAWQDAWEEVNRDLERLQSKR